MRYDPTGIKRLAFEEAREHVKRTSFRRLECGFPGHREQAIPPFLVSGSGHRHIWSISLKSLTLKAIRRYQAAGGSKRLLATACNFEPTCSEYTYQAIEKYGLLTGVRKGLERIGRCTDRETIQVVSDPLE